ncbi:MAG TPA: hypothetical protein VLA14_01410 [Polyangia bacterium]|nr:hypothetical protein [Polyangia bacterium]
MKRDRDDLLFLIGLVLWVAILALTWPRALSFIDEIGYVGSARLLLGGHLGHVAHSPGAWISTPNGPVAKFSLAFPALLAPFVALTPRAAFAVPVIATLLIAATARAALKSWGRSPLWALLVLGHPTLIILARTAMADVPQAAAALGGWWLCKRGRTLGTIACLAILVVLKPTGAVLALAIVAGEALTSAAALRAREAAAWRRVGAGLAGGLSGLALSLAQNWLATGTFRSVGYDTVFEHRRPFALVYATGRLPTHLVTLLFVPPLLLAGAWPFWRRRDLGPLLVVGGYLTMMCVYFFSDVGATRLETLVLSPRLILPVVVFLLVGYGAWLAGVIAGLRKNTKDGAMMMAPTPTPVWLASALLLGPLAVTAAISVRHARYQRAMGEVRVAASARAEARTDDRTLGVTDNALKAGVLNDGATTVFNATTNRTPVVFCSELSASHRDADQGHGMCGLPGYHVFAARDGFYALERDADARR